jgi:hypothetical protein
VVPIYLELGIVSKLGFFTTDDATVNDLTIGPVLIKLHPGILQSEKQRVRCLCHIINSAAQAFLFARDRQSLEEVQFVSPQPYFSR